MKFTIFHTDAKTGARTGEVETAHGRFRTPAFMPVGTAAAVKGMTPQALSEAGGGRGDNPCKRLSSACPAR
jgi:queuine tRNA-ribosyltransferase